MQSGLLIDQNLNIGNIESLETHPNLSIWFSPVCIIHVTWKPGFSAWVSINPLKVLLKFLPYFFLKAFLVGFKRSFAVSLSRKSFSKSPCAIPCVHPKFGHYQPSPNHYSYYKAEDSGKVHPYHPPSVPAPTQADNQT